ncbi:hypothetical protein [Zobellia nedashkovskayae]|uniref:hypothetical protein n=1 Tax=Zobellia nedashkovskayae TaxID=2779510 RepID=UPI00188C0B8E|nr:hypothetical protein [Zobellia nedashkovskayae]
MIDEIYFKDDGKVNITAASVGISKRRWICANESEIENESYLELMRKNRFDLLPIVFKTETKEYYITAKPNEFTQIERKKITFDDTLDLNTNIRTVIDSFSSKKRTFYFLTFQKEIAGLITIGNLNCRQVQIYIFQHLCDLERTLGDFLISKLNHDEIIEWIKVKSNPEKENDKYSGILKLYENLTELDLENKITEHLYFVDFFNIINDLKLYEHLEISGKYWTKYNSINEIRKRIAHPTRSLLDKENTIEKLSKRLGKIDELLFTLNNN